MKSLHVMTGDNDNVVDIRRHQQTREQVLERLFSEYGSALRVFLRARMRVAADMEDVVQEVFIRLARMPDLELRLPDTGKDCKAFIFTAANNLIVDMERRKAVRKRYHESEQAHATVDYYQVSPEVMVAGIQELGLVEQAIIDLPPKWRKAFVLSRFRHLSYKEIAEKMGITTRTVENYMSNALVRVRSAVSRATGEGR